MSRFERWAGCGCVFLPLGLFALAMTFGLMLAEGPQADGHIGQEPGRGLKILLALGVAVGCAVLGSVWISGRPRGSGAGARLLLGLIALGFGVGRAWDLDAVTMGVVALALGLIVSAYVVDRPPQKRS